MNGWMDGWVWGCNRDVSEICWVRWLREMGFFLLFAPEGKVAWDTVLSDCREWMGDNSLGE